MASPIILKVNKAGGVELKYHKNLESSATTITLPQNTVLRAIFDQTYNRYRIPAFTFDNKIVTAALTSVPPGSVGPGRDYVIVPDADVAVDELAAMLANMAVGGRSRRHKRQRRTRKGKRRSNGRKTR